MNGTLLEIRIQFATFATLVEHLFALLVHRGWIWYLGCLSMLFVAHDGSNSLRPLSKRFDWSIGQIRRSCLFLRSLLAPPPRSSTQTHIHTIGILRSGFRGCFLNSGCNASLGGCGGVVGIWWCFPWIASRISWWVLYWSCSCPDPLCAISSYHHRLAALYHPTRSRSLFKRQGHVGPGQNCEALKESIP